MSKKEILESIAVMMLVFGAVVLLFWLVAWNTNNQWVQSEKDCAANVKLVGATEYRYESYTCLFVKDGKLQEVK